MTAEGRHERVPKKLEAGGTRRDSRTLRGAGRKASAVRRQQDGKTARQGDGKTAGKPEHVEKKRKRSTLTVNQGRANRKCCPLLLLLRCHHSSHVRVCVCCETMKNEARCRRKEGAQRKLPHPTFAAKLRKFFALKLDIKVASALKIVTCISFSLSSTFPSLSLGLSQFSFLKLHTQLASEKCRSLS